MIYIMSRMIVSNVRFPEDEWLQLKAVASTYDMSANEYLRRAVRIQTARNITATKKTKPKKDPYQAMEDFIFFASKNRAKREATGASEEDKIIYDVE
ncbi:MAG: hypothetical protein UU32_C0002G0026 [Candidatus Woesebacteria bacterium GW2011_GWB1_41_10]|uniref:Uncharacterized protein n=1 Tax=Candidatus Woesebacteria bacterium GW2011_GWB1_41_10 TaxID=1618577 RepID=A0A0G0UKF4_9BACT|nr:MAG: hypothetical protein UU32_C0002G0026 [Candidatus Woesebacteria bacterium GW2011_GWB1_41_10]